MVRTRKAIYVGNQEVKRRYIGNKLIFEKLVDMIDKVKVSGVVIFTDKADDSVVHVEVDGKSVGGDSGKNLLDIGKILRDSGSSVSIANYQGREALKFETNQLGEELVIKVDFKEETPYTFQYEQAHESGYPMSLNYYYTDGSFFNWTVRSESSYFTKIKFTSDPNKTLDFVNANWHVRGSGFVALDTFQIEEGSTATAYEPPAPTPDFPIKIHSLNNFDVVSSVGGRNLVLDSNNILMNDSDHGNSELAIKEEDYVSITPTVDGNVWNYNVKTSLERVQGETYTVSLEVNTFQDAGLLWHVSNSRSPWIIPNTNGEWAKISYTYTQAGVTKLGNVGFIWGFYGLIAGNEIKYRNLKLEKGNIATPAPEDITESDNHPLIDKINISLSEPLRSVGDIKDRLFRDSDGLWKVERNVGEFVLQGNHLSGKNFPSRPDDYLYMISGGNIPNLANGTNNIMLTHAPTVGLPPTGKTIGVQANSEFNVIYVNFGEGVLSSNTSPSMRNWLDENAPILVYELEYPVIEILDQELQDKLNNLRSFQDSNYVYTISNTDISPTLHTTFKSKGWYDNYQNTLLK